MRSSDYGLLGVLAAMWGLSYVLFRVGAPLLGPALFADLRVGIAGVVLMAYLASTGDLRPAFGRFRTRWRAYTALGALNSAIPFTLIGLGELLLAASYASVLNATAPLFSVGFGALLLGQRITAKRLFGIFLGILGVVVVVGAAPFALTLPVALAIVAIFASAASYGLAAIFVKRSFADEAPFRLSLGQQLFAFALLVPIALPEIPTARFTTPAIVAVLLIALLSTTLAYAIYFRILQTAGPTQALTVAFLMPIFGVIWGAVLLGEPIGPGIVLGVAVILLGVALVTDLRLPWPQRTAGPAS